MEIKKEAIRQAGQVDISNALQHLEENKSLQKKVFEALFTKYILGKEPENVSAETKAFFKKFQFYVKNKKDPIAEYQLYEELQRLEDLNEQREVIQEQADEVRTQISFLEQEGQEPIQWLEEYKGQRDTERREVMSKVTELNPGDTVTYTEPVGKKVFSVIAHNRQPRVVILRSEDGEERRILYRNPISLEESTRDIVSVAVGPKNEARVTNLGEKYGEELANAQWEAQQAARRAATKRNRNAA